MRIINQSYTILYPFTIDNSLKEGFIKEAKLIEIAGRTAYKSENNITDDSYNDFIRRIIKNKHEAVIEFGNMGVKFTTNRGVSHELVRHRLCSFVQESTRYCNYIEEKFNNKITVVRPSSWNDYFIEDQREWENTMNELENKYFAMINRGRSPQQARGILPNDLKTEIVVRTNFREWRHIFKLRCTKTAHPDIRALFIPLRDKCIELLPCVFEDLKD
jgi:thymidylate synthase (FAD)